MLEIHSARKKEVKKIIEEDNYDVDFLGKLLTEAKKEEKEKDSIANYDRSRTKLNFEIGKGGVVKEVDSSISIDARMRQNLEDRNIKIPVSKPGSMRPRRVIAQIIFGGSREDMHRLAFGMQAVDLSKSGDNSHIERREGIEFWAKDTYDFVCRKFGEENIVGFYVHLDETNPHIHCSVIPSKTIRLTGKVCLAKALYMRLRRNSHSYTPIMLMK